MTYKEARHFAECLKNDWAIAIGVIDVKEFGSIALDCIEKQIPKKYTTKESHWKGKRIISCPVCSHAFESYFTKDSLSKEAAIWSASCVNKFCPWCGQKIDWSETDG